MTAKKYRLSRQFYYLKSKGFFVNSAETDSHLYKIDGSGKFIIECFENHQTLTELELHHLLKEKFKKYSESNTQETNEFLFGLIESGILEEAK